MNSRAGRRTGVLADWNDERGFGFLEAGGRRTFVHISAFEGARGRPQQGDFIEFELGADDNGRPCAVAATRVFPLHVPGRPPSPPSAHRGRVEWLALGIVAAFAAWVAVAVHMLGVSGWVPVWYAAMSLATFVAYAADKRAAVAGGWRTREAALQTAALLGGWPGGVLAQQFLRHKNRKSSFQLVFWLVTFVNVVVSVVLTFGWPHLAGLLG
ncbi:MAG: DUF1294 domain-containing protein [Actinobacteria bacterium]|nr:DUF1294 domain-containing protein [Actinomycetota bacterium]